MPQKIVQIEAFRHKIDKIVEDYYPLGNFSPAVFFFTLARFFPFSVHSFAICEI